MCVYVCVRARKCVYVGARVPVWTRTIVCLCASAMIVCASVLVNARARPCVHPSSRLLHLPTLPHPSIHPCIYSYVHLQDPSIHPCAIYHFPCSEGGSQKPTQPWLGSQYQALARRRLPETHAPAGRHCLGGKGRSLPLSIAFLLPTWLLVPSRPLPPLGPQGHSSERNLASRVLLTTSAHTRTSPKISLHQTQRRFLVFFFPLLFILEAKLGSLDKKN